EKARITSMQIYFDVLPGKTEYHKTLFPHNSLHANEVYLNLQDTFLLIGLRIRTINLPLRERLSKKFSGTFCLSINNVITVNVFVDNYFVRNKKSHMDIEPNVWISGTKNNNVSFVLSNSYAHPKNKKSKFVILLDGWLAQNTSIVL